MNDLISRQAAIEVADAVWSVTGDKNVAKVWDQIKDLPSTHCDNCPYSSKYVTQEDAVSRKAAIDAVKQLPPVQRWIPVSERLPEERDFYLAVFREPDGFQLIPRVAEYNPPKDTWEIIDAESYGRYEWAGDYYDDLTCVAWQPLPKPYKEVV